MRTFTAEVRKRVLAAIRRIIEAEAAASGAPKAPEFQTLSQFSAIVNDQEATETVRAAFCARFGRDRVVEPPSPASASEDFGAIGEALGAPYVYWFVGGTDPAVYAAAVKAGTVDALPGNHAPDFAPVIETTLKTGVETLVAAAGAWLAPEAQNP